MGINEFDLSVFEAVSLTPRTASRNIPVQVEGYDLSGMVHFVLGIDMTTGQRVRVFLRDMRKDAPGSKSRPGVIHYATDPFDGLTESDYRDRVKMERINASLEAKCYTAPGGVLMVQGAYDDSTVGALSANWINRVIANADDINNGTAVLLSPSIARLSTPVFPREGDTGTIYCYCDVLHTAAAMITRSPAQMDEQLFKALSVSPSAATGKFLAAIRVVEKTSGHHSTKLLERRAERVENGTYTNESPASAIERFRAALTEECAIGMKEALTAGKIEVIVIPVTRYRLVGKSLEAVEKESTKRMHLPFERFQIEGETNGFMEATVVLRRFASENGHPEGDEDYFVTSVYPTTTGNKPVSLKALVL